VSGDPYLDPRTGALRNRLGIVDADELTQVESDLTVVQMVELERRHLPGRYDLPHLQDFTGSCSATSTSGPVSRRRSFER
jgi:cell filamentation protein